MNFGSIGFGEIFSEPLVSSTRIIFGLFSEFKQKLLNRFFPERVRILLKSSPTGFAPLLLLLTVFCTLGDEFELNVVALVAFDGEIEIFSELNSLFLKKSSSFICRNIEIGLGFELGFS
jgi:hypothetical protein